MRAGSATNVRRYEFPATLDLRPYTQEYMHEFDASSAANMDSEDPDITRSISRSLTKPRLNRRISRSLSSCTVDDGDGTGATTTGANADANNAAPPACYEYELVGIVAHTGSMSGGHYYSFIKDKRAADGDGEEQWFEYNDEHVRACLRVCMLSLCLYFFACHCNTLRWRCC